MKKGLVFFVVLLFLTPLVLGATIHGKVFDYNLRPAKNSIVTINTVPEQMVVSVEGTYSFTVLNGDYVITATLKDEYGATKYSVKDNISIIDEGDYVRDLIMFPYENLDELDLENDIEQDLQEEQQELEKKMPLYLRIIISAILLGILGVLLWFILKDKSKKRDLTGVGPEPDDLKELLAFIKKHKRATQKQIRKEFPLSEAKISLMITDLESQGKIRKIKKGRGNVIVYVKS